MSAESLSAEGLEGQRIPQLMRALRDVQARSQLVLETALDAIVGMDQDGLVSHWNPEAERMFGFLAGQAVGRDLGELIVPERYRKAHREGLARYLKTEEAKVLGRRIEISAMRADGVEIEVELAISRPIRDGDRAFFSAFIRDISEQKRMEARLLDAEKLAALGRTVASFAHDIATPIGNSNVAVTTLSGSARDFRAVIEHGQLKRSDLMRFVDDAEQCSQLAERNLTRAVELLGALKQIALDQGTEQKRQIVLDVWLRQLNALLLPIFKDSRCQLEVDIPANLVIETLPGPLGQVITNLVYNAVLHGFDANNTGGVVRISAGLIADAVRLTISDNGLGMSDEVKGRAFEAFFTTRAEKGGTGLGLHIVKTLVEGSLMGRLQLDTQPGVGTSFTITLPQRLV